MTGRVEHSSGNARTPVHAGFDRDKARDVLESWQWWAEETDNADMTRLLDALAGCFDAPTTINRDELELFFRRRFEQGSFTPRDLADEIAALLRPDPRIARIEEFLRRAETQGEVGVIMPTAIENIRKILRGEDA